MICICICISVMSSGHRIGLIRPGTPCTVSQRKRSKWHKNQIFSQGPPKYSASVWSLLEIIYVIPPRLCSYSQLNVSKDIFRATHSLFDILHLIGDESGRRREREGRWVVLDYRGRIKTQSNRLQRIDRKTDSPHLDSILSAEENNNFVLTQRVSMDWEKQFFASFGSN